jgi:branched-chain amino acid transport system substrate-binding protein
VLINIMGGTDQVNSMKQFNQFGLAKQMAMAGALLEQETIEALPAQARAGWWVMEWYWNQPDVPHMKEFVDSVQKATGKIATARHWFGYVAAHTVKLAAEKAKSMDGIKMAKAMEGLELPPEVALQKGKPFYRAGDHELMSTVLAGECHNPPAGGNKYDLFSIRSTVDGEKAAGPVADTGCTVTWPA